MRLEIEGLKGGVSFRKERKIQENKVQKLVTKRRGYCGEVDGGEEDFSLFFIFSREEF